RVEHNELTSGESSSLYKTLQWIERPIDYIDADRTVFYYQNPSSKYDLNLREVDKGNRVGFESTQMNDHLMFMENSREDSSIPLIYPDMMNIMGVDKENDMLQER
ncbi:MAG: hypothetical protein SVR94_19155, partial [Pseudomonadota bacterium]|nr:hypothetical protein [Pseudomonadota bacterium]